MKRVFIVLILAWLGSVRLSTSWGQVDTVWVRHYDGPVHHQDYAVAVAVDDSGNVIVTGLSVGDTTSSGFRRYDLCTIKYKSNGDTAWLRRFTGSPSIYNELSGHLPRKSLTLDSSGNVYIAGPSGGQTDFIDAYTIKYRPNGDTAWVRRYGGPGWSDDDPYALALDQQGNVYVTGQGDSSRVLTLKYDNQGNLLWKRSYPSVRGTSWSSASSIGLSGSGDIYVGGSFNPHVDSASYFLIVKYNPNGDTVWTRRYESPLYDGGINALAVDSIGNVYATGVITALDTFRDWCTVKYRPNGDLAWVRQYSGNAKGDDFPEDIILDSSGGVYVTGVCWDSPGGLNVCTFKYDTSGAIRWLRKYDGGVNQDGGYGLALDRLNNVYVGGFSDRVGTGADYCIIKYNPAGVQQWITFYDGPLNGDDGVSDIVVDSLLNVYVTGDIAGTASGWIKNDFCTIKYHQTVGVEERGQGPTDSKGRTIKFFFVSPMKDEVKVSYYLPRAVTVRLDLYDVVGRKVVTLKERKEETGLHEVHCPIDVPPGVYFLRLSTGGASLLRKGVVVR